MDWIDGFLDYTEGQRSPGIFRLWTGISIIAGAAERRIWTVSGQEGPCYPNLFVMLVAPPAVGKGIIREATDMWRYTKGFKIAPDDISIASFVDALADSKHTNVLPTGKVEEYHFLQCAAEEFGVFIKAYDMNFLATLSKLWNNPPAFQQTRRTAKLNLDILNPGVNLITGVQPGILAAMLPPEAWTQGFMGRTLMIYCAKGPVIRPFEFPSSDHTENQRQRRTALLNILAQFRNIRGPCEWTPEAIECIQIWYDEGLKPVPSHSKLEHYCGRRFENLLKLCMISGLSRNHRPFIDTPDFDRAISWLLAAEERMPDVFRAMIGRSDNDVMEEAFIYVWQIQGMGKKVTKARLAVFLAQRVPQEKVESIITLMKTMKCIEETGVPDEYRALTKDQLSGVE